MAMATPSMKKRTVRGKINLTLILLFAVMLLVTAAYLNYSQRSLVERLVEEQASNLADAYFDTINTLMLTGGMSSRDIPRDKLLARPEVLEARIVRGEGVSKVFGPGRDYNRPADDWDRAGLAGETHRELREGADGRVLTLVVPMAAGRDYRGIDCLTCHLVPEGEILGAIRLDYSLKALDGSVARDIWANVGINSALMVACLLIISALLARVVSRPLGKLNLMMKAVAEGNADFSKRLNLDNDDEFGDVAGYFDRAVGKFGGILEETRRQSEAATRIKTALDCVSTNVMVADKDYNIIYLNPAVQAMFRAAESDLRERLPAFDASDLLGRNIDLFHRDLDYQRGILERLTETHLSQVQLGPRTFRILANPVIDAQGEHLGTAVEWTDLTAQLRTEREEAARLEGERRQAAENLRIRTALDNVSSCVMLTDAENNIIYTNRTVQQMFRTAAEDIRRQIPGFDAERLVGTSIDRLHSRPAHQRTLLTA
jgi:PAS domain-containing protein